MLQKLFSKGQFINIKILSVFVPNNIFKAKMSVAERRNKAIMKLGRLANSSLISKDQAERKPTRTQKS